MDFTPLGIVMLLSAEQPLKAEAPMLVIVSGKTALSRLLQ